jgi:hypothetical protein
LAGPVSTVGLFVQNEERYFIAEDKVPMLLKHPKLQAESFIQIARME